MSRPLILTGEHCDKPSWCEYKRGCRCDGCRKANRERHAATIADLRARARAGDGAVPHGTAGAYDNWGCRCAACTASKQARNAAYRAAHPVPAGGER